MKPGDQVYAGTLNLTQSLKIEVTAADDATLLAEIGRLMMAAEQGKARYRRLADRAAQIYAPAVHGLGLATFLGWLAFGAPWQTALTYAIAVLIITCPCALALAVPAVQIAAASRLFKRGIMVKAPDGLERIAEIDMVVFDKTGTLTLGKPQLVDDDGYFRRRHGGSGGARRIQPPPLRQRSRRGGGTAARCRSAGLRHRGDAGRGLGAPGGEERGAARLRGVVRRRGRQRRRGGLVPAWAGAAGALPLCRCHPPRRGRDGRGAEAAGLWHCASLRRPDGRG